MSDERHNTVSRRAYELWEQAGGEHGRHEEHWHQANLELEGGSGDAPTPADATADRAADVTTTADTLNNLPSDDQRTGDAPQDPPASQGELVAPDGTTLADAVDEPASSARPRRRPPAATATSTTAPKPRKKAR